jgi:hypothetical protein
LGTFYEAAFVKPRPLIFLPSGRFGQTAQTPALCSLEPLS